jgi:hypothetical protein
MGIWRGVERGVAGSPECQELSALPAHPAPLIRLKRSETQNVDLANQVEGYHYLRHVYHRFALHCHEQDRIFQKNSLICCMAFIIIA